MSKLRLLDLFSGIGGFSLGLERTGGFETVAFCEIEPFPRKVLAKHWPEVPCYDDIRELTAARLGADGIGVDAICGGFPCQDISTAGKGAGIEGERSGLWSEYARLIGELRPRVVFVENVAALLGRGLDKVLGDLAAIGYDAEWHCIPASAVGAPHRRDRLWIIAYSRGTGAGLEAYRSCGQERKPSAASQSAFLPQGNWTSCAEGVDPSCSNVANASCERCGEARQHSERPPQRPACGCEVSDAMRLRPQRQRRAVKSGNPTPQIAGKIYRAFDDCRWLPEPELGRVANGVPDRTHRLKALGNAVVPQIPELLGRAYLQSLETA